MTVKKAGIAVLAICLALVMNIRFSEAYTEEQLPEAPRVPEEVKSPRKEDMQEKGQGEGTKEITCIKSLLPSWIQNAETVKIKGFIIELKECRSGEQGTLCTFSVTNCSRKDAWLYLDSSSYLSDDKGGSYAPQTREFGANSAGGDDFVKAFLPSGVRENARVVFGKVPKDAKKLDVGIIMTGGAWAGDIVKALFHDVKPTE